MTYELIITEKPNAAKKIAEALADGKPLKKGENKVSYYEISHGKQDIVVACAVGHLYGVAEKDKKKWSYPVFSTEWVPSSDINKAAAFTTKYLNVLKKLGKDATSFTVATDYDIEGEVIGYNILRFACKQKDAQRMKFSTLTKEDLVTSYETKLKTLDWGQVNAGVARHEMDWLYGINLSRALTLAIKQATGQFKLLSSGRVQGPALKILVDREREIQAFKPVPFWELKMIGITEHQELDANHTEDKFWEKKKAEAIYEKIKNEKKAKVESVEARQFKDEPPVPFDLTSLQIEAHKTIRLNPKTTLDIAQVLYTDGFISYPRTSSQKLPKEIGYKKILDQLKKQEQYTKSAEWVLKGEMKPTEGKKTDPAHPAIYPTGLSPRYEDKRTMQLYDLIVRRFLAVFGTAATRETNTITFNVKNELFDIKGTRTVEKGWYELYGPYVMLEEQELPKLEKGKEIPVKKIDMLDKETSPPKRYTAASIIKELEKRNLGTKATRAQIVENLYNRGYLNEKSIQATELGMRTCKVLEEYAPRILDEALTRHFEEEMEEIREKKRTPEQILDEVKNVLTKILEDFKQHEKKIGEALAKAFVETRDEMSYIGQCPNCKGDLQIRKGKFGNFIACNKYPDCKTTFSIPAVRIKPLRKECETCHLPMVKILKKRSAQDLCINPACASKVDKSKIQEYADIESGKKVMKCPTCKEHNLVVRKSIYGEFLGCPGYPKCRYTEKVRQLPAATETAEPGEAKDTNLGEGYE